MTRPAETPPDDDLIGRWRDGDERAAAELVRRHGPALAHYLGGAGAGDDVDDLVQEAFFRAFRRIESYRGTASFRTWLLAIGSNALKDLRRRHVRRPVVALNDRDVVDEAGDPHAAVVERDLEVRLQAALEDLPPMQRDVFLLRAQQGCEYDDIAEALGTTAGAARVHYHHAVKRLKKGLGL
ncbi:MAG: RNA polymerase sigma factor [Gemmatimonadales bacterium]